MFNIFAIFCFNFLFCTKLSIVNFSNAMLIGPLHVEFVKAMHMRRCVSQGNLFHVILDDITALYPATDLACYTHLKGKI